MRVFEFGKSPQQIPIIGYEFGDKSSPQILILGGVHGDEYEGVTAARGLLGEWIKEYTLKLNVFLIPDFNPEGILWRDRLNSQKVDLNRNLPTKDWNPVALKPRYQPGPFPNSEPENQALVNFIKTHSIKLIISLHSFDPMINVNGDCLPEAEILNKMTNYKITHDMGYSTPGSLGTWGAELNIGVITYEIQRDSQFHEILQLHLPALKAALKVSEERFRK